MAFTLGTEGLDEDVRSCTNRHHRARHRQSRWVEGSGDARRVEGWPLLWARKAGMDGRRLQTHRSCVHKHNCRRSNRKRKRKELRFETERVAEPKTELCVRSKVVRRCFPSCHVSNNPFRCQGKKLSERQSECLSCPDHPRFAIRRVAAGLWNVRLWSCLYDIAMMDIRILPSLK